MALVIPARQSVSMQLPGNWGAEKGGERDFPPDFDGLGGAGSIKPCARSEAASQKPAPRV